MSGNLNQAEYGTIPGKVVSSDENATVDSENGNVYFKVKVNSEKIVYSICLIYSEHSKIR